MSDVNRDKEVDASETILGLITESSAFTQERFSTIREGVQAFLDRDNTKAIHVLIPQIEASLRRLYMMALLSDERGLNLRNEICHGLAHRSVQSASSRSDPARNLDHFTYWSTG